MATKITRDVMEGYLNCKYKGHLKLAGEDPEQGVFLTPAGSSDTRRCQGGGTSTKGRVLAVVPEDLTGPLLLEIAFSQTVETIK